MANQQIGLGAFPEVRKRRLRTESWLRDLTQETTLSVQDLIWPVFVQEGTSEQTLVASMPGVSRYSVDLLLEEIQKAVDLGILAIALFPVIDPSKKTIDGEEAFNPENLVCKTVSAIKQKFPKLGVICDVALDPFTSHGQDGIVREGKILNDETTQALCKQAIVQAQAGCDVIAPSDMMDGRIGAIRKAIDAHKLEEVAILSYAAKYASSFYGPFRDAVGSSTNLGSADKRTYQMNPANSDEALHEVALDLQEGADMVMVKPAMPYLDIIRNVKQTFHVPTFAYQVSGEYAMLKAASQNGWLEEEKVLLESVLSIKRAGADAILTYAAPQIATLLKAQK